MLGPKVDRIYQQVSWFFPGMGSSDPRSDIGLIHHMFTLLEFGDNTSNWKIFEFYICVAHQRGNGYCMISFLFFLHFKGVWYVYLDLNKKIIFHTMHPYIASTEMEDQHGMYTNNCDLPFNVLLNI